MSVPAPHPPAPRMWAWALATAVLAVLTIFTQQADPGSVLAVTLYKGHLMSLGGWGGYWLDRALFPYDRPHLYVEPEDEPDSVLDDHADGLATSQLVGTSNGFHLAMLRRAVVVAACLVCVGLGA